MKISKKRGLQKIFGPILVFYTIKIQICLFWIADIGFFHPPGGSYRPTSSIDTPLPPSKLATSFMDGPFAYYDI